MTLDDVTQLLILELQSRKLSPQYIRTVKERCRSVVRVLGLKELRSITHHDIRLVLAQSVGTTAEHNYRFLRRLFGFALNEELVKKNPMLKVAKPKLPIRVIQPLTTEEIARVFQAAKAERGFYGIRDAAIFALLVGTGLRRMELCGLKDADVRLQEGVMKVMGKGGKERLVPLPSRVRKLLARYRIARGETVVADRNCDRFFLDRHGQPIELNALTQLMRKLGDRAGIKLWTHRCRHSFASAYMAHDGSDVLSLQAICGWSTLAMANRYAKVSLPKLQRSMEAFSPVNDL